jgi:hypothetical protein
MDSSRFGRVAFFLTFNDPSVARCDLSQSGNPCGYWRAVCCNYHWRCRRSSLHPAMSRRHFPILLQHWIWFPARRSIVNALQSPRMTFSCSCAARWRMIHSALLPMYWQWKAAQRRTATCCKPLMTRALSDETSLRGRSIKTLSNIVRIGQIRRKDQTSNLQAV